MNKIYKLIWSKVKNMWVVASELAKSHTKAPNSGVVGAISLEKKVFLALCSHDYGESVSLMNTGIVAGTVINPSAFVFQKEVKSFKITVAAIVKNEAENVPTWVQAARSCADEIIVVDTGSTDGTVERFADYGIKCFHYDWHDDFASAKNYMISLCHGDWIVLLDGDEWFREGCDVRKAIAKHHGNPITKAIIADWICLDKDRNNAVMFSGGAVRAFRNQPDVRYFRKVHENLTINYENFAFEPEFKMYHTGYSGSVNRSKHERNLRIMRTMFDFDNGKVEYPTDWRYIEDTYAGLGQFDKALWAADKMISYGVQEYSAAAWITKFNVLFSMKTPLAEMRKQFDFCFRTVPSVSGFRFLASIYYIRNGLVAEGLDNYIEGLRMLMGPQDKVAMEHTYWRMYMPEASALASAVYLQNKQIEASLYACKVCEQYCGQTDWTNRALADVRRVMNQTEEGLLGNISERVLPVLQFAKKGVLATALVSSLTVGMVNDVYAGCVIGGTSGSACGTGAVTIGGCCGHADGDTSVVVGGCCNTATSIYSAIVGGHSNEAGCSFSVVISGECNKTAGGSSLVAGGFCNLANGHWSTITSGYCNTTYAYAYYSAVVGGQCNMTRGQYTTVIGGCCGLAYGRFSTAIGGGITGNANCEMRAINSVAIGKGAKTTLDYEVAIGSVCAPVTVGGSLTATGKYNVVGGCCNAASGFYSTIIGGCNNTADVGSWSVVVGGCCGVAYANSSTAIGGGITGVVSCCNTAVGSVAIGRKATTTQDYEVVIGSSCAPVKIDGALTVDGAKNITDGITTKTWAEVLEGGSLPNTLALGTCGTTAACASGTNALAIGEGAVASGDNAISIGTGNQVRGDNSGAIGDPNIVDANNSYTVGNNSTISANVDGAFVLGNNVTVNNGTLPDNWNSLTDEEKSDLTGEGVIALGNNVSISLCNKVNSSRSSNSSGSPKIQHVVAVGDSAIVGEENAVALGYQAEARALNTLAGGTCAKALSEGAIALGQGTVVHENSSFATAVGYEAEATGEGANAFGDNANAGDKFATAFGRATNAQCEASTAIGNEAITTGKRAVAIGNESVASGEGATSVGNGSNAVTRNSVSIGNQAVANGEGVGVIAIGNGAQVGTADSGKSSSTAVGALANVQSYYSTALGAQTSVTANNSVALGAGSVASQANVVSVGAGTATDPYPATRKIINVTDGTANTDASTIGQTGNQLDLSGSTLSLKNANGTVLDTVTLSAGNTYTAGNGLQLSGTEFSAKAGTNVTVNSDGINVVGNGTVVSGNTGLISGGTLYSEGRVASDGNYVQAGNTIAGNLTALDTQVKVNADALADEVTNRTTAVTNEATARESADTALGTRIDGTITDLSVNGQTITYTKGDGTTGTITTQDNNTEYTAGNGLTLTGTEFSAKAGTNVTVDANGISVAGNGSVADGNTGLVSGGMLFTEGRVSTDGNYVKANNTVAGNLTALDNAVKDNADDIVQINTDLTSKANISLNNITNDGKSVIKTNAKEAINVVGSGKATVNKTDVSGVDTYTVGVTVDGVVAEGNTGIVDGGTVYSALQAQKTTTDTALTGKANVALDNVTEAGHSVIKSDAKSAINAVAGTHTTISKTDVDGVDTYAVNVTTDGAVVDGNTGIVTGGTVYTAVNDEKVARENADTALSDRIGILSADGNYIRQANNVSQNLVALDGQVKANANAIIANKTKYFGVNAQFDEWTDENAEALKTKYNVQTKEEYEALIANGLNIHGEGALGKNSVAIGTGAIAGSDIPNSIGATQDNAVAIGNNAKANAYQDIAIGDNASTVGSGNKAIAIGAEAKAKSSYNIAMGYDTEADGVGAFAIGKSAKALNADTIAIGYQAQVIGGESVSIGIDSIVSGGSSVAIGQDTKVDGNDSVAIGYKAYAKAGDSVALGESTRALAGNSVAIGNMATVSENADGGIAVGFLAKANSSQSTSLGEGSTANGDYSVALGNHAMTGGLKAVALGNVARGVSDSAVAIGDNSLASGEHSIAIGGTYNNSAEANGTDAIAIGSGSKARSLNTLAIGVGNNVTGLNGIAVGSGLTVNGANSGAFGDPSVINATNSYSVGNNNTINSGISDVFVLGNSVTATNTDTVILGSNSEAKEDHVVSVGRAEVKDGDTVTQTAINRRIVNVGAGVNDTDVVNVSQLNTAITNATVPGNLIVKGDIYKSATVSEILAEGGKPLLLQYLAENNYLELDGNGNFDYLAEYGFDGILVNDVIAYLRGYANNDVKQRMENSSFVLKSKSITIPDKESINVSFVGMNPSEASLENVSSQYNFYNSEVLNRPYEGNEEYYRDEYGFNTKTDYDNYKYNYLTYSNLYGGGAQGIDSIAIGSSAYSGRNSISLGMNAKAISDSVSIGNDSVASGNGVSIGSLAKANSKSVAIGSGATTNDYSSYSSSGSIAIGNDSFAGLQSIVIGDSAKSLLTNADSRSEQNNIVIGNNASAEYQNTVALGYSAKTSAPNSVALGYGSIANEADTVSVGYIIPASPDIGPILNSVRPGVLRNASNDTDILKRRVVNVADGTAPSNAATVNQTVEIVGNGVEYMGKNAIGQDIVQINGSANYEAGKGIEITNRHINDKYESLNSIVDNMVNNENMPIGQANFELALRYFPEAIVEDSNTHWQAVDNTILAQSLGISDASLLNEYFSNSVSDETKTLIGDIQVNTVKSSDTPIISSNRVYGDGLKVEEVTEKVTKTQSLGELMQEFKNSNYSYFVDFLTREKGLSDSVLDSLSSQMGSNMGSYLDGTLTGIDKATIDNIEVQTQNLVKKEVVSSSYKPGFGVKFENQEIPAKTVTVGELKNRFGSDFAVWDFLEEKDNKSYNVNDIANLIGVTEDTLNAYFDGNATSEQISEVEGKAITYKDATSNVLISSDLRAGKGVNLKEKTKEVTETISLGDVLSESIVKANDSISKVASNLDLNSSEGKRQLYAKFGLNDTEIDSILQAYDTAVSDNTEESWSNYRQVLNSFADRTTEIKSEVPDGLEVSLKNVAINSSTAPAWVNVTDSTTGEPLYTEDEKALMSNEDGSGATGTNSIAIGSYAYAGDSSEAVTLGTGSRALGNNTTVVGNNASALANDALAIGYNASSIAENAIALGKDSVADEADTISVGRKEVKEGNTVTQTAINRRIVNVGAGINDTDAVNVSQLTDGLDSKANTSLDNITDAGKTVIQNATNVVSGDSVITVTPITENGVKTYTVTANVSPDGQIAESNTGLVSGGTVYSEVRPSQDGNYITTTNTTGANLTALDTQVKANADAITTNTSDISNLKDLSNITEAGQNVIKELSKGSVNVVGTDKATVTKSDVNGVDTYTVSVKADGQVVQGNENIVSGGTVYDALSTTKQEIATDLAGKANVALDNVTDTGHMVIKTDAKSAINVVGGTYATVDKTDVNGVDTYTVNVANDGAVAQGDNKLVTGGTVYDALQSQNTEIQTALNGKANVGLDNITDNGKTVVRTLAQEAVKVVDGTNTTVTEGTDGNAKTYAVNVTTDGTVTSGDTGVVTGGTVYNAIQDIVAGDMTGKANVALDNVNEAGHAVIKTDAKSAVNVVGGTYATVAKTDVNGVDTYTVNVATDGAVASGNEKLVTGGTVYDALNNIQSNINDALDGKANVGMDNLTEAGTTVIKNIAKTAINVTGNDDLTVTKTDVNGTDTYGLSVNKKGTVVSGNTGIITGGAVYSETRPASDGTYITTENTAGANLTALDTAIAELDTDKANVGLDNISPNGQTVIKDLAKESVKVVAGTNTTVTEGTDGDAKTYAVNTTVDGIVTSGNTGIVSGGTVYDALQEQASDINDALDAKANKDASNVADNTAQWGSAIGTGTVADGNGELVTGGTVYTETRPVSDGNYVKVVNSAGANLTALDTAVKANADAIEGLDDGKANVSLDNITSAGETVVKDLAKEAVKVVAGTNTTVTEGTDGDTKTYAVNTTVNGVIASGNTGIVDGGTVYNALQDLNSDIQVGLDTKANKDASNVAGNTADWGAAIGTGIVADSNGELVTGGTVYTETRPATDGNYIATANTAGENLTALDTQIKTNTDNIATNTSDITNLKDLSNITEAGKTVIKELSKGSVNVVGTNRATVTKSDVNGVDTYTVDVVANGTVTQGNENLVSGGTVYEALQNQNAETATALDGKANIALDNITDNGKSVVRTLAQEAVKVVAGSNTTVTEGTEGTYKTYAVNTKTDGTVSSGDTGIVTGGAVYDAIQNAITGSEAGTATDLSGKANIALDNITDAGHDVIKSDAKSVISVAGNDDVVVNKTDVSGVDTYNLSVNKTGVIASGNEGIVTGGTVFSETRPASDGNYIATAKSAGENLTALDTQIKANTDAISDINTGLDDKANTSLDNITNDGETVIKNLAKGSVNVVGEGKAIVNKTDVSGVDTYTVSVTADGSVAEGNGDIVSGGTVYEAIQGAISISEATTNTALEGKANVALDNVTDAGHDVIKSDAKSVINVAGGEYATVEKTDVNGVDTYTINVATDGVVASGNTKLVTGNTVYEAMTAETRPASDENYISTTNTAGANLTALDSQVKTNADVISTNTSDISNLKDLSNITEAGENVIKELSKGSVNVVGVDKATVTKSDVNGVDTYTVSVKADGTITEGNENIVSGGTVYSALQTQNTEIQNALDTKANKDASNVADNTADWGRAIGTGTIASGNGELVTGGTVYDALQTQKTEMNTALGDKANVGLDNITDDGKTVVRMLAQDAVKVVDGTYTTVTEGTDGVAKTYAVNVSANGIVASGNTGLVTGGTVYDAIQDISGDVSGKANTSLNNITTEGESVVKDLAKSAVSVVGTDKATVTKTDENGVDTYTVSVKADGTVAEGNENIVSGGTVYEALQNQKTEIDTALAEKANVDASNVTDAGAWGTKIATGSVADGDVKAVSGGTMFTELRPDDGNYVAKSNTTAQNLIALDTQVKANADNITTNTSDIANLKDLSNITEAGESVIKDLSKGAVNVVGIDKATVTKSDVSGVDTYTVSVKADGIVTEGNENLVSGGTVYEALATTKDDIATDLAEKANVDASNVASNTAKWGEAIGTGTISSGNGELVTGGTVFAETRPTQDGNYILKDNTAGANLTALDSQVKTNADAIATNATDISNLKDLSNITDAGKTVIKDLSKGSVNVVGTGKATVTKSDTNGVDTYTVNVDANGQVAQGNEDIVTGGMVYDAIQNMSGDVAGKANVALDNITTEGETVVKNLAKGAVNVVGNDDVTVTKTDENGVDTYTVSVTKNGTITEGNEGVVTGGTVYEALKTQETATETALDGKANVDASNVTNANAWGEKIATGEVTQGDVRAVSGDTVAKLASDLRNESTTALDTKANTSLDNITTNGETVIRELAKGAVRVVNGEHTTVTESTDGESKTYAVNVVADGAVEANNTGLVTGSTVYNETRIARDGNYVSASNPAKDNIMALDNAVKGVSDIANSAKDGLDGKANTNLDNISADGEEIIKVLAKGAVNVKSGDNTNVVKTNENGVDTYTVHAVGNGIVTSGDTQLVTGGTVYNAIEMAKQDMSLDTDTKLEGYAKVDASNITNASAWADKLGIGTVSATDGNLITGSTVATETRVSSDGNYVQQLNTAGQNIAELDRVLKETRDIAEAAAAGEDANAVHYDNADKGTVTLGGADGTLLTNLKDGELSATSKDAVTGKQLYETNQRVDTLETTVGTITDGNYISKDFSVGENLSTLDTQIKSVSDGLDAVSTDIGELRTGMDNKLNTNMDNLTNDGRTVISDIAKGSVKVTGSGFANVTSTTENDAVVYNVDVQANGKVEEGNTGLVDGGTVFNSIQGAKDYADTLNTETRDFVTDKLKDKADTDLGNLTDAGKEVIRDTMKGDLDKKANVDASNIDVNAWAEKLGTGEVADGDTGLVNGGTVFKALQGIEGSDVVKADFDAGAIRVGGSAKYDGIDIVDISKSNGEGRVMTGVITNPNDPNSAANVGYVNAIGENIMTGVNREFGRMDSKINRVGANAAAMASLTPMPNEDDTKWNIAAAVGNYRDATAGAVGVFYKPAENVMLNVRGSFGTGDDSMVGGGVTIALNKNSMPSVSKAQLVKTVNAQANRIQEMEAKQKQAEANHNAEIAELKAQMAELAKQVKQNKG